MLAIIETLEAEGVRYAVFGALALAAHGIDRATRGLDVFVAPDEGVHGLGATSTTALSLSPPASRCRLAPGPMIDAVTVTEPGSSAVNDSSA